MCVILSPLIYLVSLPSVQVLILSEADGGSYELVTFSTDTSGSGDAQDVKRGSAVSAIFVARDKFAVLDKSRQLLIKNFQVLWPSTNLFHIKPFPNSLLLPLTTTITINITIPVIHHYPNSFYNHHAHRMR